jgi:hypothetical protein
MLPESTVALDRRREMFYVNEGRCALEAFGQHVDRHFFRRHLMLSACAAAIVLVVIGFATGVGPLVILGGAFCLLMMAMMLWMMVGMMRGHGH